MLSMYTFVYALFIVPASKSLLVSSASNIPK